MLLSQTCLILLYKFVYCIPSLIDSKYTRLNAVLTFIGAQRAIIFGALIKHTYFNGCRPLKCYKFCRSWATAPFALPHTCGKALSVPLKNITNIDALETFEEPQEISKL